MKRYDYGVEWVQLDRKQAWVAEGVMVIPCGHTEPVMCDVLMSYNTLICARTHEMRPHVYACPYLWDVNHGDVSPTTYRHLTRFLCYSVGGYSVFKGYQPGHDSCGYDHDGYLETWEMVEGLHIQAR